MAVCLYYLFLSLNTLLSYLKHLTTLRKSLNICQTLYEVMQFLKDVPRFNDFFLQISLSYILYSDVIIVREVFLRILKLINWKLLKINITNSITRIIGQNLIKPGTKYPHVKVLFKCKNKDKPFLRRFGGLKIPSDLLCILRYDLISCKLLLSKEKVYIIYL